MSRYGYKYFDYDPEPLLDWSPPAAAKEDVYVEKVQRILSSYPSIGVPPEPSIVTGCVYLGTTADAENLAMVKAMGINYILNCAGGHPRGVYRRRSRYTPDTAIMGYEELHIEEWEDSDIRSWFERAHTLIDHWKTSGGKVLIHCPGVSRSGAIALSYLVHTGIPLLQATKMLKDKRRCLLNNDGYIQQVVAWAYERGLVDFDVDAVRAPRYGRALDKYRIKTAHLPTFL